MAPPLLKQSGFARFSSWFPALLLAELALVGMALANGVDAASWDGQVKWRIAGVAVMQSLLVLLRSLPVLLLLSWPLLALRWPRVRFVAVGVLWSVFIVLQLLLDQYFQVTHVPLGADLFGYSVDEIRTTVSDGAPLGMRNVLSLIVPLAVLWAGLWWRARCGSARSRAATVALVVAGLAALLTPLPRGKQWLPDDAARDLACNKLGWFVDDVRLWQGRAAGGLSSALVADAAAATHDAGPIDPAYPFLREENTPDTLGAYFNPTSDGKPPNVVLIVVEGLGRSFSGPKAPLGSFTPFLDELAGRSLYFENFLANQGRTFGVLPSLLGSAPNAEQGFTALGTRMPAHPGLFSVLGKQGYHTAFYNGTDTTFDNERGYLQLQNVQSLVDLNNFGPGYARNPFSSWGYTDKELVSRVLADTERLPTPFALAMQTISMHTSYEFPDQEAYRAKVRQRLQALGIPAARQAAYLEQVDIYSTIVFTDEQLRRYFERVSKAAWYANTIFVITGDHRLPEIPMGEHVDRYHVPLIVYSPLLKQPRTVRAVSSHLDVTPGLMALLSNTYGLQRPARTPWLGTGLDMGEQFRSIHEAPLQQTKTSAVEFLADQWWLRDGKVYELQDGMHLAENNDASVRSWLEQRAQRYRTANALMVQKGSLTPDGGNPALVAYHADATATAPIAVAAAPSAAGISLASAEIALKHDGVQITAMFSNGDSQPSRTFVPLAVIATEDGRELKEAYGPALRLPPRGRQSAELVLPLPAECNGRCFVSVFPSDPDNGKSVGQGRYRLPVEAASAMGGK